MSGNDAQGLLQWGEALLWLDKAAEDIAIAHVALREDLTNPAAFHVQQAVEKILKGLLLAAAQDLRKTHDIEQLAELTHRHWPDLVPVPFPLISVTQWYVAGRYPGIDEPVPSAPEISEMLQKVIALLAGSKSRAPGQQ